MPLQTLSSARPAPMLRWTLPINVLLAGVALANSPPTVNSQPSVERGYRLYVGLDVEVSQENNYALVEGYVNNRVRTDLSTGLTSLRHIDNMRFTYKPKLSRKPLTVKNVQTDQIADTRNAALKAMRDQMSLAEFRDGQMARLESDLRSASAGGQFDDSGELIIEPDTAAISDAMTAMSDFDTLTNKITNETDFSDQMERTDGESPTALLITAELSSPNRINDAYIIGRARISTEESASQDVLFFDRVGRLDQKPKRIKVIKQGLPVDFEVIDVQIHVYRNGQELATNQSSKQIPLTRAEALQYLALQQMDDYPHQDRAPEPAWSLAPPDLLSAESTHALDYPLTVNVDASGQVTGVAKETIAPTHVTEIVQDLLFFPALDQGQPVAGVAHINLKDFFE